MEWYALFGRSDVDSVQDIIINILEDKGFILLTEKYKINIITDF